jgi:hypothetical protein
MAYHHIIPFSLLRDVWNRLVDQHIATTIPEARVAIRQYLLLADRKLLNIDALIDRMRADNLVQRRATHNHLPPLDVPEALLLATAAVWPAWNIVEGPQRRSDDPRDHYFDRFTSGLTGEESIRMVMIERLFGQFQSFASVVPVPDANSLRSFAAEVAAVRPIVCCESPIRYRPEMWIQGEDGLWRKRRDGERYTAGAN